jgi:hypothetical protein
LKIEKILIKEFVDKNTTSLKIETIPGQPARCS